MSKEIEGGTWTGRQVTKETKWTTDRYGVDETDPLLFEALQVPTVKPGSTAVDYTDFASMMAARQDPAQRRPVYVDQETARSMGLHRTRELGVRFPGAWDRY